MVQRAGDDSAVRDSGGPGAQLYELALAADASTTDTSSGDAAAILDQVLTGQACLTLHFVHADRRVLLLRVGRPPSTPPPLTQRERDVVAQRLRGASLKAIATGFGVSISTVAKTLKRAMSKLQMRNLAELISVLGGSDLRDYRATPLLADGAQYWVLSHAASSRPWPGTLTRTEREIVTELLAGCSNGEIALRRGVALRTVANQVASIFKKVGVHSRMDLVRQLAT